MRPDTDEYYLRQVEVVATKSTCVRRSVGCILVNKRGHNIGSGYNGVEAGAVHCNEWSVSGPNGRIYPYACKGAFLPSGQGLDECDALHAEMNALLQCRDVFEIWTCYVTDSPCVVCVKLLMGTSCQRVVFRRRYSHDEPARLKWLKRNNISNNVAREWIHLPGDGS